MHLREKAEVVCMQETHCDESSEKVWEQEYRGYGFWSNGSTEARGVGILIKKDSTIVVNDSFKDKQGRIVGVQIDFKDQKYLIVNIYAPNVDEPRYFLELFRTLEEYEGKRIILGDFNMVLDQKLDRSNEKSKNNKQAAEVMAKYMEDTFLIDIWRARNPSRKTFTYQRRRPCFIGSRIDNILVDASIGGRVDQVKILPGFKTDHSAVFISLIAMQSKRGRGMWRMNTQILYETEFLNRMNKSLIEVKDRSEKMESREIWELMKLNIIGEAQSYSQERVSNRKLILSQLEEKIEQYENKLENLTESEERMYMRTKKDVESFMDEKAQGAMFPSGQAFYSMGEKSNKYFFQLEKQKAGAKGINTLILQDGLTTSDSRKIRKKLYEYYKALYQKDENVEFTYKNDTDVRLTEEAKASLEGEITMKELGTAIKQMKRGKAPGCDGICAEFYMVFFKQIGHTL